MVKGFVTTYKDKEDYVHLYFFPGIDEHYQPIYKDIDLTHSRFRFIKTKYIDNAVDYKFYDKRIVKINCKLRDFNNNETNIVLHVI